jgi:hypothetical protein
MSNTSLSEDLAFVRQMAEEGASAPSLSGRYSLWWGVLVTLAMLTHWATLTGLSGIPPKLIGLIWMTMAVVGVIGNVVIGATNKDKPGRFAPGNRADAAVWPVVTAGLFTYAIAVACAVALRDVSPLLFDTIIPVAFVLHASATAMSAALFRDRRRWILVALSLGFVAATMFMVGQADLYLVAAAGIFVTQIIPSIFELRAEPQSVV